MIAVKRHASIRATESRGSTAHRRRSDGDSRGLVGRRTIEAVGNPVVESQEQRANWQRRQNSGCHGRLSLSNVQRAHRGKRAILTIVALLGIRTARHIGGHHRHIAHRRHVAHRFRREQLCRCWRGQRRNNEPNGRKDHEQAADESTKIHGPISHTIADLGRQITSQIRKHN